MSLLNQLSLNRQEEHDVISCKCFKILHILNSEVKPAAADGRQRRRAELGWFPPVWLLLVPVQLTVCGDNSPSWGPEAAMFRNPQLLPPDWLNSHHMVSLPVRASICHMIIFHLENQKT